MAWRKGMKSPNPGGRPKGLAARVRAATMDNQEQVDFYLRLSRSLDPKTPETKRVAGATLRDVKDAHQWLTDRGQGKAVERVVMEEAAVDPMDELSTEELRAIAKGG